VTQTCEGVMVALPVKGVREPRTSACLAENGGLAPGEEASLNACQGPMSSLAVTQEVGAGFGLLLARFLAVTAETQGAAGVQGEAESGSPMSANGGVSLSRLPTALRARARDQGESAGGGEPSAKPCSSSREERSSLNGEGESGARRAEIEAGWTVLVPTPWALSADALLASNQQVTVEGANPPDGDCPQADRVGGQGATAAVGPVGSAANPVPSGLSALATQADRVGGQGATVAVAPVAWPTNPVPHTAGGIAIEGADNRVIRKSSTPVVGAMAEKGPVLSHVQVEVVAHPSARRVLAGQVAISGESMESGSVGKDGSVSSEALVGMSPDGSVEAAESKAQSRAGFSPAADRVLLGGLRATDRGGALIGVADVAGQVSEAAETSQGSETPGAEKAAASPGLPVASTVLENGAGGESEALPGAEYALVLSEPSGEAAIPRSAQTMGWADQAHSPEAHAVGSSAGRSSMLQLQEQLAGSLDVDARHGPAAEADLLMGWSGAEPRALAGEAAEEVSASRGLPGVSPGQGNGVGVESEALPDDEPGLMLGEPLGEAVIPRHAEAMGSADQPRAPEGHAVASSPLGSRTVQLQEEPADPLDGEAQHAEVLETDLLVGWPDAEPNGPVWQAEEAVSVAETWLPMGGGTAQVAARMARVICHLVLVDENRAVLQLHPPELGRMSIRVTMGEGGVAVEMLVQDQAVKSMVEAQLDQLGEALAGQGLRTATLSVQVGQHADQGVWSWLPRRSNRSVRPDRAEPVRAGVANLGLASTILAGRDCTIDYWI